MPNYSFTGYYGWVALAKINDTMPKGVKSIMTKKRTRTATTAFGKFMLKRMNELDLNAFKLEKITGLSRMSITRFVEETKYINLANDTRLKLARALQVHDLVILRALAGDENPRKPIDEVIELLERIKDEEHLKPFLVLCKKLNKVVPPAPPLPPMTFLKRGAPLKGISAAQVEKARKLLEDFETGQMQIKQELEERERELNAVRKHVSGKG